MAETDPVDGRLPPSPSGHSNDIAFAEKKAITPKIKMINHHDALLAAAGAILDDHDYEEENGIPFDNNEGEGVGTVAGYPVQAEQEVDGKISLTDQQRNQQQERQPNSPSKESSPPTVITQQPPSSIAAQDLDAIRDDKVGRKDEVDACGEFSHMFSEIFLEEAPMVTKAVIGKLSMKNTKKLLLVPIEPGVLQSASPTITDQERISSSLIPELEELSQPVDKKKQRSDVDACDDFSNIFSDVLHGDMVEVTKNAKLNKIDNIAVSQNFAVEDELEDGEKNVVDHQQSFKQTKEREVDEEFGQKNSAVGHANFEDEINNPNVNYPPETMKDDSSNVDLLALSSCLVARLPTQQRQHSKCALVPALVSSDAPSSTSGINGNIGKRQRRDLLEGDSGEGQGGADDMLLQIDNEMPLLGLGELDESQQHNDDGVEQRHDDGVEQRLTQAEDVDDSSIAKESAVRESSWHHHLTFTTGNNHKDEEIASLAGSETKTTILNEKAFAFNSQFPDKLHERRKLKRCEQQPEHTFKETKNDKILESSLKANMTPSAIKPSSVPDIEEKINDSESKTNNATDDDILMMTESSTEMRGNNNLAIITDQQRKRRFLPCGGSNSTLKPNASDEENPITNNSIKGTLVISTPTPISPIKRRERIQWPLGSSDQYLQKPNILDDDNSVTTKNSKETPKTNSSSVHFHKLCETKKLCQVGDHEEENIASSKMLSLSIMSADDVTSVDAAAAVESNYNKNGTCVANLIRSNERKVTLVNNVKVNSDKRREKRKPRRGGEHQELNTTLSEIMSLPVISAEETMSNGTSLEVENVATNNSTETFGTNASTVKFDKHCERRNLRWRESMDPVSTSGMIYFPVNSGKEATSGGTVVKVDRNANVNIAMLNTPGVDNSTFTHSSKERPGFNALSINSDESCGRRKLRRGESKESTSGPEIVLPPVLSAEKPTSDGARAKISIITSNKRRARRKLRQIMSEPSKQQENAEETKNPPHHTKTERWRQRKVPIPKALLNQAVLKPPQNGTTLHLSLSSCMEDCAVDGEAKGDDRGEEWGSPPKTPTNTPIKMKFSLAGSASAETVGPNVPAMPTNNTKSSATSPSSQERLIVTPTSEVEMRLVEGEGDAHDAGTENALVMPNLQTVSNLDKHDGRRNQKHLRKGPTTAEDQVVMALNNNNMYMDEIVEDMEEQLDKGQNHDEVKDPLPSPESIGRGKIYGSFSDKVKFTPVNSLGRDQLLRQRKASALATRSNSVASSCMLFDISHDTVDLEVLKQITVTLEKERSQRLSKEEKDRKKAITPIMCLKEGSGVDDAEARALFPYGECLMNPLSEEHHGAAHTTPFDSIVAWDTNNSSNLNQILEQSKAHNKQSAEQSGGSSLLHLETRSSDHDGVSNSLEAASIQLLAQSERMAMYTSGEGFGVGEDSSIDVEESEISQRYNSEEDDRGRGNVRVGVSDGRALFDYEDMNNIIDDAEDQDDDDEDLNRACEMIQSIRPASGVPAISPGESTILMKYSESRTQACVRNPDAMSQQDDGSEIFNTSNTMDRTSTFGMRFVGSSTVHSNSTLHCPVPPQSPFEISLLDASTTPKIGSAKNSSRETMDTINEDNDGVHSLRDKLFKIPSPPPEKLRRWEGDKGGGVGWLLSKSKMTSEGNSSSPGNEGRAPATKRDPCDEQHSLSAKTSDSKSRHRCDDSLNYKIYLPKSPSKPNKKKGSLIDELNLASHKRMAEKIAFASSKAARKFEEEYSHSYHHHKNIELEEASSEVVQKMENSSISVSTDRFFCAGDAPLISEPLTVNPEQPHVVMPTVMGELVRGAFSPWKIPDRAEDEMSSISSSARLLQEGELYTSANAVPMKSIHGQHHGQKDDSLNESYEVSLEDSREQNKSERVGLLTEVLQWLFEEVLPSESPIAAAFSAFDINTSTTVQSDRVLAIANDDESLNIICSYVAANVMKRYGSKAGGDSNHQMRDVPRQIIRDDALSDVSVSTCDSSLITTSSVSENKPMLAQKAAAQIFKGKELSVDPFEIPPLIDGSGNIRPSPDVLAANFVGFLQQISAFAALPSPFGNDNPFLQSVVHNLSTQRVDKFPRREARKNMQDLVFPNTGFVVSIFQFLQKACKDSACREDINHVLSAIEEGTNDGKRNSTDIIPLVSKNTPEDIVSSSQACSPHENHQTRGQSTTVRRNNRRKAAHKTSKPRRDNTNLNLLFPNESPSPFETAVWNAPSIVLSILSFIGNPVVVCVMKRLNVFCNRVVCENQHVLMRDAVRLGGMSKYVRPSFWLWVTEMWKPEDPIPLVPSRRGFDPRNNSSLTPTHKYRGRDFLKLTDIGSKGKWQHVIERDVTRAFGNMPPHKTGARYRQDSIVRALVSFGKEEIMRNSRSYQGMDKLPEGSEAKHFKLSSRIDCRDDSSNGSSGSLTPTDTVSDWGGISPVGSMVSEDPSVSGNTGDGDKPVPIVSCESELLDSKPPKLNISQHTSRSDVSDPVLSGNALTSEMKVDLQNKLRMILHALAARHEGVGYCQGMDYVVAHLLRVLQDTILLRVVQRSMPYHNQIAHGKHEKLFEVEDWRTISSDELRARMSAINSQSVIVEEVVFGVMDTFFSTYGLQHMYWPELRCLKTCCRVFESLIKQKLPVLADHFQHHDLNVGLFALGWFQTLFLYLPGMPSTTVCHMWDIWLVERSFKIFFRVGTAILFLSQPTLLNHDLEGMMTYLNTFPDATLLRRDILIPCALQIKITNRMLVEIEMDLK